QSLIAAIFPSSSATWGPPIQTWESSTSATAASTCSRMVTCCALRSRRGTFIGSSFDSRRCQSLHLIIVVGSLAPAQFWRKLCLLVEIETAQQARLGLPVAEAAFRADHD